MDFFKVTGPISNKQWMIGVYFIAIKLITVFLNRQNSLFQNNIGFQTSVELNSIIFDKLLRESPSGRKEKVAEGQIVNYFQIDSQKLGMTLLESPNLIVLPIQIVYQIILLFKYMGLSSFAGLGTLALFLLLNVYLAKTFQKLNVEIMRKKDSRMKYTSETFNSLKILKLYAWDEEYLERVVL